MSQGFIYILGVIVAIILTVYVYGAIMPQSKDGHLNRIPQRLHDFFHFKKLYIEAVLRFFYVFSTICCVCIGFFMLFGKKYTFFGTGYTSTAGSGIMLMVFGPIACRIFFEVSMMIILLVTNVISIRNYLYGQPDNGMLASSDGLAEQFAIKAAKAVGRAKKAVDKKEEKNPVRDAGDMPGAAPREVQRANEAE